ncbi:hypothetical protein [Nocardia neocaledoniensis]|uniref:hypothetical protein n=1 Tax=Nocardia neocaledoniensis TaxID=236511 RepID=UPI00245582C4|nr:hypothetical protein [Nocardia neocaledoniensis]
MSRRGQLSRTPENFPRMKYRARKRHARNNFEPLLFDFMRSYPDFAASLGTSLGVFVEQLQKLAANVRTIRAQAVADYSASLEQMRRPWFASLADAEARGAKGSAEVGFAQCRCEDCEQRDAELLRRKPLDEVVADG